MKNEVVLDKKRGTEENGLTAADVVAVEVSELVDVTPEDVASCGTAAFCKDWPRGNTEFTEAGSDDLTVC